MKKGIYIPPIQELIKFKVLKTRNQLSLCQSGSQIDFKISYVTFINNITIILELDKLTVEIKVKTVLIRCSHKKKTWLKI